MKEKERIMILKKRLLFSMVEDDITINEATAHELKKVSVHNLNYGVEIISSGSDESIKELCILSLNLLKSMKDVD